MLKRMILMLIATSILFGLIFGYKAVGNYFMNDFFDNMPTPPATITASDVQRDDWIDSISSNRQLPACQWHNHSSAN